MPPLPVADLPMSNQNPSPLKADTSDYPPKGTFLPIPFYQLNTFISSSNINIYIITQKESEGKTLISTKGRYALRIMIDLAQHGDNGNVPLKDIAERQQISKKYLEIIVSELVKAGMLSGVSGKGGGYSLCRKPEEYTAGEIIEALEGTLAPVACLEENAKACPLAPGCHTLPMWKEYHQITRDFFFGKKLSDLL